MKIWKECIDAKGLKVNFATTKDMESGRPIKGCGDNKSYGKWPCVVSKKGSRANCTLPSCTNIVIYSGVSGSLSSDMAIYA